MSLLWMWGDYYRRSDENKRGGGAEEEIERSGRIQEMCMRYS